ncbi:nascent polypeptide-associated complex subunit alpha, muscle-specific form-like isoform X2 [Passer montanus]|uniref:nascent polypeptide-associated complex subunit alpha, muscle-specific form-like isoform X2 n=1 Tax=Passer montanus TaxID=9160 RepID=UPI00196220CD|nr:nascent polypeptide-associated complex subunit alpha, muscle-specific form-like isoform X2 [Passer montanus]
MRTWRAGGRAHARRSAGTARTPRAHTPQPLRPTPRPHPAPPAPVPPVTYLRHRLASFSSSFSSSPGEGAARSPISGADTALPARRDRCSRGGRVGGHRHLPDASPGSPTASLRPSPRCCFVISCPSCDTRRPLYGNLKGTFTSAAAGPAGTPGGLRAPPVLACPPSERSNRGITGRAGTVRKDGLRSWRLRDPLLVYGRGGSPLLEEAEKQQQRQKIQNSKKKNKNKIRRKNPLFVSDRGGADSARAGSMRWSPPPRLTPPVGSEAIPPSRPVAPAAPDSRLPTAGSVPSCCEEPLLGMCAGRCNTASKQPALTGRRREDADNSGSLWFPAHPAARLQPPGARGRPAAAPRSSGCCSACGAEVGFVPCSPPAPRIWDQGAEAHSLRGPTAGLTMRRGLSGFYLWEVPVGGPQILLPNRWHRVSVGDQVQGFRG